MPDRAARGDGLGGGDDGVGVDAVAAGEVGDGAGLAEMLDAQRAHAVAVDGPQPGKRRRVVVEHGDEAAVGWHLGEQPLDVGARAHIAALARALGGGPAGIEAVGRGDGEQADVAAVLGDQVGGLDRLGRDRARADDNNLTIGAGAASSRGPVA